MNIKTFLLAGALIGSSGQYIEAQPTSKTAASFSGAREMWKAVSDDLAYLDERIAARKLSEVHEAAFNLRDSARMLRGTSAGLSEAQKGALERGLARVDTLANDLDASGDKNDLRATVANQRKMHVALDAVAGAFPKGSLPPVGAIKGTGPVKDPVCRMTVDPSTAPGKVAYQGQTYYFCSVSESQAFQKSPARYAALYDDLAFGKPKTFAISLDTSAKVAANKPALLTFAVREQGQSQLVKQFQLVHEKLMHLIVVSDDLSYFSHEHPQIGADGRFRLKWTFPRAGRYLMFADFTPDNGLNQVLRTQVTVSGGQPKALPKLVADKTLSKTVDGYTISLKSSTPLMVGKSSLLTYSITRGGKTVTDMQPYLGAMGHMMAINANGRDVVHTHTVGAGGAVTNAMATEKGPRFTFDLMPTAPGMTKIWAQFQRGGKVITVPFTFPIGGTRMITPAAPKNEEAPHNHGSMNMNTAPTNAAQNVMIALPAGYKDGAATVQAGKPVTLTFKLEKDAGCGNTISVPSAKWTKTLEVGQSASVTFTPQESGPLKFSCGMDMLRGTLVVK
ncbi:YHS domain-containing protein [bacterium]|nr:MAG: YHS domain-containing protein [bacterium]